MLRILFVALTFFKAFESQKPLYHSSYANLGPPVGLVFDNLKLYLYFADSKSTATVCTHDPYFSSINRLTLDATNKWSETSDVVMKASDLALDELSDATIFYRGGHGIFEVAGIKSLASILQRFAISGLDPLKYTLIHDASLYSIVTPYYYAEKNYYAGLSASTRRDETVFQSIFIQKSSNSDNYISSFSLTKELYTNGSITSSNAVCSDDNKCLVAAYWSKVLETDPEMKTQPPGLYYKVAELQDEATPPSKALFKPKDVDETSWNWLRLDGGSEIQQYQFTSYQDYIVGVGYGPSEVDCRPILTSLRYISKKRDFIEQVPALLEIQSSRSYVDTKVPRVVQPDDLYRKCSGLVFDLSPVGEKEFYMLRYGFKAAEVGGMPSYKVSLRYSSDSDKKLVITMNDSSVVESQEESDIYYSVDRTAMVSSKVSKKKTYGKIYNNIKDNKGTLLIIVDHGVVEVFFENGRYVVTEAVEILPTLFDQVCVENVTSSPVSIISREMLVYDTSLKSDLEVNVTDPNIYVDVYGSLSGFSPMLTYSSMLMLLLPALIFFV